MFSPFNYIIFFEKLLHLIKTFKPIIISNIIFFRPNYKIIASCFIIFQSYYFPIFVFPFNYFTFFIKYHDLLLNQ